MSSSIIPSTGDHLSITEFLDDIFSDFPPQNPTFLSSGSDSSTQKTNGSSSSSDDGEMIQWDVNLIEERKKKRKMSNRESARRSRMRKQKHLENLKNQVARYETSNQELMNRLRFVNHNGEMLRRENERLRSASVILQQRLCNLHHLLVDMELHQASAWPCNNNVTTINEQNLPSLITF